MIGPSAEGPQIRGLLSFKFTGSFQVGTLRIKTLRVPS